MRFLTSISVACVFSTFASLGCTQSATLAPDPMAKALPAATLQTHHWQLQATKNAQGTRDPQWQVPAQSGVPATIGLRFTDANTLTVDRLCNHIHGRYQTEANQLKVSRMVSTMMACNDPQLMKLERNVTQQLPEAQTWAIEGDAATPLLTLTFADGQTWTLKGTPTYETLYGNSQTIFLEVNPHKETCTSPLQDKTQCLQVRLIEYDDKGIKQGTGPWQAYYGAIEGYTPQPDVRNVLRIKRYTKPQAPADASSHIDVLDMVVESEIVK